MAIAARYKGYRYPIEVIGHAVWLYHRFALSLRDVEELMLACRRCDAGVEQPLSEPDRGKSATIFASRSTHIDCATSIPK